MMNTASHKQRLLNRIFTGLKGTLDADEPERRPVLEQLLYAVCREGVSRQQADRAFQNLRNTFFDWNEIRVSSEREVEDALGGLPEGEARAARLISLLQEVFESTFSFDLESLQKKGLKQAEKQLERYQAANPFVVAWALQTGLDGHAIPLDDATQRTLRRLELLDEHANGEGDSGSLEHLVPKARGPFFCEMISALAHEYCHETSPCCTACPMNDLCPAGQKNLRRGRGTARAGAKSK